MDKVFYRPSTELSAYYWEYVNVYPQLFLSGLDNIAMLEHGLLQIALEKYNEVQNLSHIYQKAAHTFFHDYRKLIRSVTTVPSYFQVFNTTECVDGAEQVIDKLYKKFGSINDEIVAYDYYVKHGESSKAQHEEEVIDSDWSDLQSWMETSAVSDQLACLLANLVYNWLFNLGEKSIFD